MGEVLRIDADNNHDYFERLFMKKAKRKHTRTRIPGTRTDKIEYIKVEDFLEEADRAEKVRMSGKPTYEALERKIEHIENEKNIAWHIAHLLLSKFDVKLT